MGSPYDGLHDLTQGHPAASALLSDLATLPDAQARDLTPQQATELRKLFEDRQVGLFLFAVMVCGFRDLKPSLHLPISQLLGRWGESVLADGSIITRPPSEHDQVVDSYRRIMVRIPREHFKTSLCTRANALWQLARDPGHNDTIAIFNAKAENAERWVGAISVMVEKSHLFQMLWPEMLPRGISFWDRERGVTKSRNIKWGEKGLQFERSEHGASELSIEPHGIGGEVTGKHFTKMILDDIIGKEARYSTAVMKQAFDWIDNSRPLERPAEGGCTLIPHTPWTYFDVYAHALKKWHGEWKLYVRHILEDSKGQPDHIHGKSIFPEKIPTEKAKRLLQVAPEINFAQYQCVPRVGEDQAFDENWFRYGKVLADGQDPVFVIDPEFYDPTLLDLDTGDTTAPQYVPLSWMDKVLILDPAPSKPNEIKQDPHANNALVATGKDPWSRRFALEAWRGREGPVELIHRMMAMCEEWGIRKIAVEEVVFSAWLAPLWTQIVRHSYDWEPDFIPCLPQGRHKDDRIKSNLIGYMRSGYWYFNSEGTGYLRLELSEFPHGGTKDLPDALSYTDECIYPLETPDALHRKWYNKERGDRGPTGYGDFMTAAPRGLQ